MQCNLGTVSLNKGDFNNFWGGPIHPARTHKTYAVNCARDAQRLFCQPVAFRCDHRPPNLSPERSESHLKKAHASPTSRTHSGWNERKCLIQDQSINHHQLRRHQRMTLDIYREYFLDNQPGARRVVLSLHVLSRQSRGLWPKGDHNSLYTITIKQNLATMTL